MSNILGLADIRDWLKTLKITADDNYYIGKLNSKKSRIFYCNNVRDD